LKIYRFDLLQKKYYEQVISFRKGGRNKLPKQ